MDREPAEGLCVAVTTVATLADAERLSQEFVASRLAACVSILPQVVSTYRWKERIETEREFLLWIKTASDRVAALRARLLEIHPYEVPELFLLRPEEVAPEYLRWAVGATRPALAERDGAEGGENG